MGGREELYEDFNLGFLQTSCPKELMVEMCHMPGGEGAERPNDVPQALVGRAWGRHWAVPQLCAGLLVSEAVTATVESPGHIRMTEGPKPTTSETGEPGICILTTSPTAGLASPQGAGLWRGHFFLAP